MSELSRGVRGTQQEIVTEKNIARALGSGGLDVYATPCMITLMEYCAMESVKPLLPAEFYGLHASLMSNHFQRNAHRYDGAL